MVIRESIAEITEEAFRLALPRGGAVSFHPGFGATGPSGCAG